MLKGVAKYMFTWNFQHISKSRLADTFRQLKLEQSGGDVLCRIHTATHLPDEAVDLAKYIKELVPDVKIFGTSTSAIISNGKLLPDQCLISITQMKYGHINTARFSIIKDTNEYVLPDEMCQRVKDEVIGDNTKLLLTFLTVKCNDVYSFVEKSNTYFPGIKMLGGLADGPRSNLNVIPDNSFVFDENGWSDEGIIFAAIDGEELECNSLYATGVESIGKEMEVTDTFSRAILKLDGKDAAQFYISGIGKDIKREDDITNLFPFVYSDAPEFPIYVDYNESRSLEDSFPRDNPSCAPYYESHPLLLTSEKKPYIRANHHVEVGKKLKRAFIYDKKIISDNRALFRKIESLAKVESMFAYSCILRSTIYSNCVKWELSAYENSNMSGCITYGEIVNDEGINRFVNGSFVVAVMGEEPMNQLFNPFAFQHAEALSIDNKRLLKYLTTVEKRAEEEADSETVEVLKTFARECENKILFSEKVNVPNEAALNLDIGVKGMDRLCIIEVSDTTNMKSVFADQLINLTFKNYISKCESFAAARGYGVYYIRGWRVVVSAKSYLTSLSAFIADMEELQKILFYNDEKYIPIVPAFSVINNCTVDNYNSAYNSSKIKMWQKNIQFNISDAQENLIDAEVLRENYHIVDVINYAISNNKVIPHFQGIYDNKQGRISHYEALMRLEDERGNIYYPNSFLHVARYYGLLYDSISMLMVKTVFERFKDAEEHGVSINLGMRDIRNRELVDYIYDFLSIANHPDHFTFELLENEDIDDYNSMIEFVDKIHELGGRIAIDDFGSGFSNLQHILNLELDVVKIDGSIVKNCCDNPASENLIALMSLWKAQVHNNIRMVAEFVENESIQNKLLEYNIDYSQGYYFSKPSAEVEIK